MSCEAYAHLGTAAAFLGLIVTTVVWAVTNRRAGRHHR